MADPAKINPPFRADHIGSLLRPPELLEAFRSFHAGTLSVEAFRVIQDQCIREVVRLQEDVGLQPITDGEFRRGSYFSHFIEAISGMIAEESLFTFTDQSGQRFKYGAPHTASKLQRTSGISTEEFRFLKETTKQTPKLAMPSPSTMHFWRGRQGVDRAAYPEEEEFFQDLIRIYREELAELYALGARYIQMDEVPLAMLCDPDLREAVRGRGDNPEKLLEKYIEITNAVLQGRPAQVTVAMHLCRGNYKAKWLAQGGYDAIADSLFNRIQVDAYLLEYDTPRAGDFAPLKYLPAHKTVVLGLMSTKTPQLESLDSLKKRVDEAGKYVPLERLAISPQCGFATSVGSVPMTPEAQRNKLRLLVQAAKEIWG
ncbi:MAG: 5-methyltetrahydropteroyltriglutamate--homocysteine S-methyltransferase [Acidobacteria bacterium]|nr:5-methyltetrahydropteroyltriglutamate--homocysteine S-methyltransferase [Acidobacteriota bacterium]